MSKRVREFRGIVGHAYLIAMQNEIRGLVNAKLHGAPFFLECVTEEAANVYLAHRRSGDMCFQRAIDEGFQVALRHELLLCDALYRDLARVVGSGARLPGNIYAILRRYHHLGGQNVLELLARRPGGE